MSEGMLEIAGDGEDGGGLTARRDDGKHQSGDLVGFHDGGDECVENFDDRGNQALIYTKT